MDILAFNMVGERIKKIINHKCGLNLSQTRLLLFFVDNNNEEMAMGDLANKLNISLSTLSRQINQRKTLDLVNVKRSKTDSSKLLSLNAKGLTKANDLKLVLQQIDSLLFNLWDQEQLNLFKEQVGLVLESLDKAEM